MSADMTDQKQIAQPKFCKDCRWCAPAIEPGGWFSKPKINFYRASCGHETALVLDSGSLVDGVARLFCDSYRSDYEGREQCGKAAKFFEARA